MGEARQRRMAKAAGNPWPEDRPKVFPHAGQYLGDDGEWHPREDYYHRRRGMIAASASDSTESRHDAVSNLEGRSPTPPTDEHPKLIVRRRSGMEAAFILAALARLGNVR